MSRGRTADRDLRQARILADVERHQRVEVAALAAEFGVTEMTIRRDLATLDRQGKVSRVHGGARGPRADPYETRTAVHAVQKHALGRAAAAVVEPGMMVALDVGTTCHAVALHLRDLADVTVVCYSLHIATALHGSNCRVIVLGGQLSDEMTLVNGGVVDIAAGLRLDMFIASCAGVSPKWGITYFDPAEVEVRRALLAASDELTVVADASKLDARGPFALGQLSSARRLITDAHGRQLVPYRQSVEVTAVDV